MGGNHLFKILTNSKKSQARIGYLETAHGGIETPVFMPVGTQATVKGLLPSQLDQIGSQIILGNTYHLHLRPTDSIIAKMGGLHPFMKWEKPILTDSGGYQVFSLAKNCKIDQEGVVFKSHINGAAIRFSPKVVIDVQRNLNSDIMMPLDICTAYPATKDQLEKDMALTLRWEKEALDYWQKKPGNQQLFAIVQGGCDPQLRQRCAETLAELPFSGYAIGGLSVGEPQALLEDITYSTSPHLPKEKPRYLMGVGLPKNMRAAISAGVDMFDCVAPTRLARHGHVFVESGHLNLKNAQFKEDEQAIEANCDCLTCKEFSRAYLRHLIVAKESLAVTLLSLHNVRFMHRCIDQIKAEIKAGLF